MDEEEARAQKLTQQAARRQHNQAVLRITDPSEPKEEIDHENHKLYARTLTEREDELSRTSRTNVGRTRVGIKHRTLESSALK